jgi:simple sugar transport system substrate-binding protein
MALALVASACGTSSATAAPSGASGSADRSGISIEVVTHGQASDPFWSSSEASSRAADMGANVTYSAPDTFDMVKMGQISTPPVQRIRPVS